MDKKKVLLIILLIGVAAIGAYFFNYVNRSYDLSASIRNYGFTASSISDKYLNYAKRNIYPEKIRKYIVNYYIPTSILGDEATGNEVIELMKLIGYEEVFKSLFDKNRNNFDDCPVTEKFKSKFNTNLLKYFNIDEIENLEINCTVNIEDKEFKLETYGINGYSANLEPNYFCTYNFRYTLDSDGNVDDIVLNSASK